MQNKIISFVKKQWLLVWIVFSVISLMAMTVSAFYETTSNTMSRVIVATSSQGMMFASNYLEEGGANSYQGAYRIELAEANKLTDTYQVDVLLYNYDPASSVKHYMEDIEYTIEVQLTNAKGEPLEATDLHGQTVKIVDKSGIEKTTLSSSNLSASFDGTLVSVANTTTENKYTLHFSGNWDLEEDTDICVQMIAKPKHGDNNRYKDLKDIAQIIGLRKAVNTESKGWQAYLKEKREGVLAIDECDGYNLVVTGSGSATITITWDTSKVDFNKHFYGKDVNLFNYSEVSYTLSGTVATMTIAANTGSNSTNHRNRYDIQLYKTGVADPSDWTTLIVDLNDKTLTDQQKSAAWVKVNVEMQA